MNHPERPVAVSLAATILGGLGLTVVYAAGGDPLQEGLLLAASLGALGAALVMWAKRLLPPEQVGEERLRGPSPEDSDAVQADLEHGTEQLARRRFLFRMLAGAAGALGLAAILPIRSLGPAPGDSLRRTAWRRGVRLVTEDGSPIRPGDLELDSVATVFPEGAEDAADSVAVLIRVEPQALRLDADRAAWAPEGHVTYSKICTHAGCPVGLYRSESSELLCPCHQSTFDVLRGALPVLGPAGRALPQLPLDVDGEGYLVAGGDFPEPVGPGFWNL